MRATMHDPHVGFDGLFCWNRFAFWFVGVLVQLGWRIRRLLVIIRIVRREFFSCFDYMILLIFLQLIKMFLI